MHTTLPNMLIRHQDKAIVYQPAGDTLEKLKVLQASREQLLNTKQRLTTDFAVI
ncbi:hypothetical protein [Rhodoflexus sp.]